MTPHTLGLLSQAHTRVVSSFAFLKAGRSLHEALTALADLADADKHATDAAVWFLVKLAGSKDKLRSFAPLAEAAAARAVRKAALSAARNSTPVRRRK